MAPLMQDERGFRASSPLTIAALNASAAASPNLENAERQKRLLPYMTFYLEQDFNRPGQQQVHVVPTSYATTGALKQTPTLLQQYHNKFTELTNGVSYQQTGGKFKLTPFLDSNALPGPFLPMRNIVGIAPTKPTSYASTASNGGGGKPPNYSAIYDKLSQLKLQQQYQLSHGYNNHNRHYPQHVQLSYAHGGGGGGYVRKHPPPLPPPPPPQQVVGYIPIRSDYPSPHTGGGKTIVQTYTPSSIEITNAKETANNVNSEEGDEGEDDDDGSEESYEHIKSYNEPSQVKNYHHHAVDAPPPPSHLHELTAYFDHNQHHHHNTNNNNNNNNKYGEVKKHVLKPLIVVRQKAADGKPLPSASPAPQPYVIIQRKPPSAPQKGHFNYELLPETINFRPALKYQNQQNIDDEEVGKIVVETVTPKYIDIIPKYEEYKDYKVKPTLVGIAPTFGKPYSTQYAVQESIPAPRPPPTPQAQIYSYQRPSEDYEQVNYQKNQYHQMSAQDYDGEDDPPTSKPTYVGNPSKYVQKLQPVSDVKFVTTPKPKAVYRPTPSPPLTESVSEPEYQEGSNSLSLILKKLQDTNALPHTLTPDNIDNSIRTLVKILSSLKKQPKFNRPIVVPEDSGEYDGNNEAGVGLGEVPGTVTQIFPENTPEGGTPGTPGVDYPALSTIPQTNFNCKTQRYKGFFGDPDTNCQVWHYCDLNGGQASFLCPNGTIFSQVALTCDWWYNVKCSNTAQLYVLNERLYKYILPLAPKFPEDYSGPLVDRYLALKFQEMEEKMKKERKHKTEQEAGDPSSVSTQSQDADDSRENEAIQDDAEELRKETHRHHTSSPAPPPAPIYVPEESSENTDAMDAEHERRHHQERERDDTQTSHENETS